MVPVKIIYHSHETCLKQVLLSIHPHLVSTSAQNQIELKKV
jgi:hypothetical protein